MNNYTGYLCYNNKKRFSFIETIYFCSAFGKKIDPSTCHIGCKSFEVVTKYYKKKPSKKSIK